MRLFELFLIACTVLAWWQGFVLKKAWFSFPLALGLITILLGFHLVLEGLRWQLFPIYLLLAVFLGVGYFSSPIQATWARWVLGSLALVSIGLSAGLSYLLPVFELPAPKGNFQVLTACHEIPSTTGKPLSIKIWLPSQASSTNPKAAYHPQPTQALAGVMGLPGFVFSHLKRVKTAAQAVQLETISPSERTYPLLIYSHGAASGLVDNTALLEHLTSCGFVVIAIQHQFSFEQYGISKAQANTFEIAAQIDLIDQLVEKAVPQQAKDYQILLNYLATAQTTWRQYIDLKQVALLGHSLGGATATYAAAQLPFVKAVVNMDGPVHTQVLPPQTTYCLYLSSFSPELSNEQLQAKGVPPEFYRAVKQHELDQVQQLFQPVHNNRYWLRFTEASHLDLTDLPYMIPMMSSKGYDHQVGHDLRALMIQQFLAAAFKQQAFDYNTTSAQISWVTDRNR